ncbi:MAG: hypothetical protein M1830_009872 [Pleopsidium flavum]|nr:MAG: hypothetical protein M1830_009872 [Pleopsidium flavum]
MKEVVIILLPHPTSLSASKATAPPTGTFLNIASLGFYSALTHVKPDSSENPVQILWHTICTSIFSPQQGYLIADKSINTSELGILVSQVLPTAADPRDSEDLVKQHIFLVKCKAPNEDTPGQWALTEYLKNISSLSDRIYAAIAISSKVKIYRWDKRMAGQETQVEEMHPFIIDIWHEADRVEESMLEIRWKAWDWAGQD